MARPRLLDLFCGAGGAGLGYNRAGFEVVGIDLNPQPNYPFVFMQADALTALTDRSFTSRFDAIHASPPCQRFSVATPWRGDPMAHPDLVDVTRDALQLIGLPYVMENVPGAPLRKDLMLCGSMFGLAVRRHRIFESSVTLARPTMPCWHHGLLPFMHKGERAYADAMGCMWMSSKEGRQAIPPAYTEHIGKQLLAHIVTVSA